MRPKARLIVGCVSLGLTLLAVPAHAGQTYNSEVTLSYVACGVVPCPPPYSTGVVTSPKAACEKRRTVVVREVGGVELGMDTTNREGVYRVNSVPDHGEDAVAIALRKQLPRGVCSRAVSEPATFISPP